MKIQLKRKFLYELSQHSEKITVEQSNNILNYSDDKIENIFQEVMVPLEFVPAYIIIVLGVAVYTEWKNANKKLHFDLSVCREYHPLFSKERKICILKVRISDLSHKLTMMKSALKKVKNTEKGKKIKEKINKRIEKISNKIQEYKNDLQKIK